MVTPKDAIAAGATYLVVGGRSWKLRTRRKLPSKLRLKSKKPAGRKQSASEAGLGHAGAQDSLPSTYGVIW